MPDLKNPKVAIPIVLFAGILWSFGPYVVRHIDQPETLLVGVNVVASRALPGPSCNRR